jgi:hypothetical protein
VMSAIILSSTSLQSPRIATVYVDSSTTTLSTVLRAAAATFRSSTFSVISSSRPPIPHTHRHSLTRASIVHPSRNSASSLSSTAALDRAVQSRGAHLMAFRIGKGLVTSAHVDKLANSALVITAWKVVRHTSISSSTS